MNEVKVYDAKGNLVRTIPKEEVAAAYWDRFKTMQQGGGYAEEIPDKTRTCEYCKKKFPLLKGRLNRFCSPGCRVGGTNRKPKKEKSCIKCKKTFLPKHSNSLYCYAPCVWKG